MSKTTELKGISLSDLKKQFSYNEDTGEITNLNNGKICQASNKAGYVQCYFKHEANKYTNLYAHRLAFLLHHGWIDDALFVDHKNGIKSDNRLCNLRLVDKSTNSRNQRKRATNNSGATGVIETKYGWQVRINNEHFGHFRSFTEACDVAKLTYEYLGYGQAHGKEVAAQ